jgi:NAD(P)-dependent dehydrogenase (short-subunit alcohol dehydrogenase family)
MRLKNKIALITGAGRGIGKAIALGFAREGADVIINELAGSDYAEEVVAEIQKMGRKSSVIYADISKVDEIKAMFQTIEATYGKLDE